MPNLPPLPLHRRLKASLFPLHSMSLWTPFFTNPYSAPFAPPKKMFKLRIEAKPFTPKKQMEEPAEEPFAQAKTLTFELIRDHPQ